MTIQGTKENTLKERNMDLVVIRGRMVRNILVFGKKTKFMEMEDTPGMMEENTREIGKITTWTGMEHIHGKTAENMKVNTHVTKNMVEESILGQTDVSTMVNGKMEDNTEQVNTFLKQGNSEKEFGIMVKEKNGSMKKRITVEIIIFGQC